jgi:hypothetical protein
MDYTHLKKIGGFVSPEIVVEKIEFTRPRLPEEGDGDPISESAELHIRKRTSRDFLDISRAAEADKPFLALHRCVCNPDGSPLFSSIDEASQLAEWLLGPILNAVNKVNSFAPKSGAARTISGTTSPPRSGKASRKRS